jgi:hypothetical protein
VEVVLKKDGLMLCRFLDLLIREEDLRTFVSHTG